MLHLITGGSGSGKSAYAEEEILRLAGGTECEDLQKYYIATMEPFGKETLAKIRRHQKLREGKGFQTVECYTGLAETASRLAEADRPSDVRRRQAVLLECMSNLVANEQYRLGGSQKEIEERILRGVRILCKYNQYVVIVTNEVCSECAEYPKEIQEYKRILSTVNCGLAEMADWVTEVVYGIPLEVKG